MFFKNKIKNLKLNKGFTLVELMVSVTIFALVVTISMGSIIAILDANRKAQTLRSVMDNLNATMESMTRTMRFGSSYHCGTSIPLSSPYDCPTGSNSITLYDSSGAQVTYSLSGTRVVKNVGGVNYYMTSADVVIQTLSFRVIGSYPYSGGSTNDNLQPRVIIVVKGYVGSKENTKTTFSLGTMVSQRRFDYQ